jgi:hypothetical protein
MRAGGPEGTWAGGSGEDSAKVQLRRSRVQRCKGERGSVSRSVDQLAGGHEAQMIGTKAEGLGPRRGMARRGQTRSEFRTKSDPACACG